MEKFDMKKFAFIVLLVTVMARAAFAQTYRNGTTFKYWISMADNTYRNLKIETRTDYWINDLGWLDYVRAICAGDPRIVTVIKVHPTTDKNYSASKKQWKVGDKATIDEIMKDDHNISEYEIVTGNGYFIEFGGSGEHNFWTGVDNRKFGVILPHSVVRVASSCTMKIISGAIGWDEDFQAASNLDDYMEYLAQKVDYSSIKKNCDYLLGKFPKNKNLTRCPIDPDNCACRGDIIKHVTNDAVNSAGFWGAVWGLAPPVLLPAEFAKVRAKYTTWANLVATVGYLYGKFPNNLKQADFAKQLKMHNYIVFSGIDPYVYDVDGMIKFTTMGAAESGVTDAVWKTTELIMGKVAPQGLSTIPVVSTLWGVVKGAYDGYTETGDTAERAVEYFNNMPAYNHEPTKLDQTKLRITKYNGKDKDVKIPNLISNKSVSIIGGNAFKDNKVIQSVTLENNARTIEAEAFMNCTSLKTVTINANNMTIEDNAFNGCKSLTTVTFLPNMQGIKIGKDAFKGTKLDEATKTRLRELGYTGEGVGVAVLTVTFMMPTGGPVQKTPSKDGTVSLPSDPKKQDAVFEGWYTDTFGGTPFTATTKVTKSVTVYPRWKETTYSVTFMTGQAPITTTVAKNGTVSLPNNPTKSGATFDGWYTQPDGGGTAFTASTKVTNSVTVYPKWKEGSAANNNTNNNTNPSNQQATLDKLTFTATKEGGYEAKQGNNEIKGDVVIPAAFAGKSVTTIAQYGFTNNANITSVTIPGGVTAINGSAFSGCKGLTSITIPASVTTIKGSAFGSCTNLLSVTFQGKVANIDNAAFSGDLALKYLDGGTGTYTRQAGQTNWAKQGGSSSASLDKLTFTATKEGGYEVKQGNNQISGAVVIPATFAGKPVTTIAQYGFTNNANITSVTIPGGVTTINGSAFSGCKGLSSITIPASVTTIKGSAFGSCTNLLSVTFQGKVADIDKAAFSGDLSIKHIDGGTGTYTRKAGTTNWAK